MVVMRTYPLPLGSDINQIYRTGTGTRFTPPFVKPQMETKGTRSDKSHHTAFYRAALKRLECYNYQFHMCNSLTTEICSEHHSDLQTFIGRTCSVLRCKGVSV